MLDGSSFWRWYDLSKNVKDKRFGRPMRLSQEETARRDAIQTKLYAMAEEAAKKINAALDAGDQSKAEEIAAQLGNRAAAQL